ncbi:MAG: NAD(P)/FAD-dependent oxidoreductase [Acidobacteriota bacterium]
MKRPFTGLRKRGPKDSYDAVVIGAGIGGLVCATKLAKEGLSVLLVEQHYMAGGYCSTFRRKGFTFDAATHFYPLLGNPDAMTSKMLADLGVEAGWIKMDPVDTFHFPDGSHFHVPADLETYRAALDAEFPHQREAMEGFFTEVREAYMLGLLAYFRGRKTERLGRYESTTLRQALDRHFDDPKLKLLLTADCPHWGSPPSRTSFVFDSMLRLSYFLGNYYPEGGSQTFADELARRFEELGGDILMSTRADRILVRDGRACGVDLVTTRGGLRGNYRVAAGTVVSNADLRLTLDHLLRPEDVDPEYRRSLEGLRPSFPCFLTHIGLHGVDADTLDRVQGYYWNRWDPDTVGRNGLRCKIFVPTVYEPAMAPPGGQIVILQKVLEMDYGAVEDWDRHKAQIENYIVGHLERVVPGIGDKIAVKLSASAKTSWRFTLNEVGAMLGWEMSPDQLGDERPAMEGPVEGLTLVGHWTRPGGGITPVIVSAIEAAGRVASGDRRQRTEGASWRSRSEALLRGLGANPDELEQFHQAAG